MHPTLWSLSTEPKWNASRVALWCPLLLSLGPVTSIVLEQNIPLILINLPETSALFDDMTLNTVLDTFMVGVTLIDFLTARTLVLTFPLVKNCVRTPGQEAVMCPLWKQLSLPQLVAWLMVSETW